MVYDRLGKNVYIRNSLDNKIKVTDDIEVSLMFISWVCSIENKMKVVEPKEVKEQVKQHLMETLEQYL